MTIFPHDECYRAFLETLEEVYTWFDALMHAYCLMRNQYQLLMETPRANLGRIMRHINIGSVSRAIHNVKMFLNETPDQRFTRIYKCCTIQQ